MTKLRWNGMSYYQELDRRRTNPNKFTEFRKHCLNGKHFKDWVKTEDRNPRFSGLFFIKHKDFPGEFDIAEFFINTKGKRFWMTNGDPVEWAEISTYEYFHQDGTPVYDELI